MGQDQRLTGRSEEVCDEASLLPPRSWPMSEAFDDDEDLKPRRPDRPGIPASPVLRPGPHGRVLRRRGVLPGPRRTLLLPPLARLRKRLRPLPGHGKSLDPHW